MLRTRRQFCQGMGLLGFGGTTSLLAMGCRDEKKQPAEADAGATTAGPGSSASATPALRTFDAATFATLSAVCERLLPRDQDPGANDLGVPGYIDRAVAEPDLATVKELLLNVLPKLDGQARKRHGGRPFHETTPAQQDELLTSWQHARGRFFDVTLSLTLEGAFGDPKHGGNLGGRGFAMIGFTPGPQMGKR